MKNVLLKAMLPVAAFVLASAGAVSTGKSNAKTSTEIDGWRRTSPVTCEFVRKCNDDGSILCTSGGNQMYEKLTPSAYCTDVLTHKP